jgi:ATP-dependent helicase/nuclease subunit A
MKLTDSQLAAIAHRGSSLLVAASAGTGKTEVLARRCVSLVADREHPCGIDRLLVVTFTRAAAAELRVRVARMLRQEAERATDRELCRHLRRQEMLVDAADIGTIDAWCGRVLREHFAEAGVDLEFSVLGEEDARLLRDQVLGELLEQIHRAGDSLTQQARAWIARATAPGDEFLRQLVQGLNAFREHLVNSDAWFEQQRVASQRDDTAAVLAAALAEECRFQWEQLAALLGGAMATPCVAMPRRQVASPSGRQDADAPRVAECLRPYCDALGAWAQRLDDPGQVASVVAEIKAFRFAKPAREAAEPPEVPEVRKRWLGERLQAAWPPETVESILRHAPAAAGLVTTLLEIEARYQQMLVERKRQLAACEFADVLRMTLDLLGRPTQNPQREPTEIARRLQRRYEHILVDEYQDTSPVQVEILRLVTRDEPGRSNRFMVGDVKQSIYGFRQAEPRLFIELGEALDAGRVEGHVQYLSDNFRSHPGLLTALDELFARLFDRALGGTGYGAKERMRAGRDDDVGQVAAVTCATGPRVEVHVIEHEPRRGRSGEEDDADQPEIELIEREAQLAANQIRALLEAGVCVPERNAEGMLSVRPLRLTDMVILLRSAVQKAGQVARVLRASGIPCLASGRESLLDAVEVIDICNVLELLVNRRQDVPLAGYLRSPLVGLTEAELLEVRGVLGGRKGGFYEAVQRFREQRPIASIAAKLDGALGQLDRWANAAREEELPALLRRVFQDSGVVLWAQALKGGRQRVALLRSLESFAIAFAGGRRAGSDDFVAYLEQLAAEEIDPGALAAGDQDVVRIMTIHGAKGLEFPVVFLLGTGTQFNRQRQRESLQCDPDLGLGLRFSDYPTRATLTSARHHVIARRAARRELEEELRLLYVAATRARERLFIVGHAPPGAWENYRAQHGGRAGSPPLISRMSVHNCLEWVLMAAAGEALHAADKPLVRVVTRRPTDIPVVEPAAVAGAPIAPRSPMPEDDAWVERGRELLAAEIDRPFSAAPAVLSVSAAKELALRARGEDQPRVLDAPGQPLPGPSFATEPATAAIAGGTPALPADGRELGVACHRFLQHADLTRLGSPANVQAQVDALVAAGRLSPEDGALVPAEDIVWFGGTAEGRLAARAAGAIRREVPFVYALPLGESGEHTIVRGVIDCLIETADGLVILDYKTDWLADERDLAERLGGYQVQLQLYAQAAGAIFARPVTRAALVFLRARRVLEVPLGLPATVELFGGLAAQ